MLTIVIRRPMHIPDGFLTPPVWLTLDVIAAPAVGAIARRVDIGSIENSSRIPLLGVMGAFVFAAQMINFPVALGTSSHLLGGTLLASVLGPAAAAVCMTSVLILQALMFQDGGVLALGANVFNMALAGVFVGYLPVWLWGRRPFALFLGGTLSVVTSGLLAVSELALSDIAISGQPLYAALGLFLVSGLLEGAITVAAFRAIERLSPGTLPNKVPSVSFRARAAIAVSALALVTAGVWIASGLPDGLQHLAAQIGLQETLAWTRAPFAGYELSIGPEWLAQPAAGMIGIVCAFFIGTIGGKRRRG